MPWRKLAHRKERLPVYRLLLDLTRIANEEVYDGDGFNIDDIMIAVCVGLGHAEARPMTPTKIALYLNMPRTTVLRKTEALVEAGVIVRVGKHYLVSEERQRQIEWLRRCEVAILSCAREIAALNVACTQQAKPP